MTKAQEVRNRRLEKMQGDITEQAKKVFDWILDLMDTDTQKGYFRSIKVCLFYDQHTIKLASLDGPTYPLSNTFFLQHDRLAFFSTLQQIVEQEEGFSAILEPSAIVYDEKAILLEIVIE